MGPSVGGGLGAASPRAARGLGSRIASPRPPPLTRGVTAGARCPGVAGRARSQGTVPVMEGDVRAVLQDGTRREGVRDGARLFSTWRPLNLPYPCSVAAPRAAAPEAGPAVQAASGYMGAV